MTSGLYQAVLECRYQQVKFFLDSGVRLSRRGNAENVLLAALQIEDDNKRRKMFNYLLKKGANYWDADVETGRDALLWACYMNRSPQVNKLLKFAPGGLDLCRQDTSGLTTLHHATLHGNVEMVRMLVTAFSKYGLCVDMKDQEGLTPLLHAKRLGHEEIATILEEEGNASHYQADDKLFKSVDGWKKTGMISRGKKQQQMAKIYGGSLRVLPELDPRGLYRTKTTMVSRKNTLSKHISFQKKAYTLPAVYKRSSVNELRSILKYKNEKTLVYSDDEYDDDSSEDTSTRSKKSSVNRSMPNSIRDMMDILSDQICDSYRDPALEKIQQTVQEKKRKDKRNTSTLASILAKVKFKTDEMEKKHKLRRELDRHTRIVKKRHVDTVGHQQYQHVGQDKGLQRKPKVRIQLPPIDLER